MASSLPGSVSDKDMATSQVIIQCPSCQTKFALDSSLLETVDSPRFHCSRCDQVFSTDGSSPLVRMQSDNSNAKNSVPSQATARNDTIASLAASRANKHAARSLAIPDKIDRSVTAKARHESQNNQPPEMQQKLAAANTPQMSFDFQFDESEPQQIPEPLSFGSAQSSQPDLSEKLPPKNAYEVFKEYTALAQMDEESEDIPAELYGNIESELPEGASLVSEMNGLPEASLSYEDRPDESTKTQRIPDLTGKEFLSSADETRVENTEQATPIPPQQTGNLSTEKTPKTAKPKKKPSLFSTHKPISFDPLGLVQTLTSDNATPSWRNCAIVATPILAFLTLLACAALFFQFNSETATQITRAIFPNAQQPAPSEVFIKNSHFKKVVLDNGDEVMLISGKVVNKTNQIFKTVQIEGLAFDSLGRPIMRTKVDLGNSLSTAIVKSLSVDMIREVQRSTGAKELSLKPGKEQDFTIALGDGETKDALSQAKYYSARIYTVTF